MNRSVGQRRFAKNNLSIDKNAAKNKFTQPGAKIHEVLPINTHKKWLVTPDRNHRCCSVTPENKDFGQIAELRVNSLNRSSSFKSCKTSTSRRARKTCAVGRSMRDFGQVMPSSERYEDLIQEQFGIEAIPISEPLLNEFQDICSKTSKAGDDSKCHRPAEEENWVEVENTDEVDQIIESTDGSSHSMKSKCAVHISDKPRVKVIAEKYVKIKKNNIELRKLSERVVCVEYDVFDNKCSAKPTQTMRAYFSLRPGNGSQQDLKSEAELLGMKEKLHLSDDSTKLNQEVEIIDKQMTENQAYLNDLKKVLLKQQALLDKKNKSSLDIYTLYEMAKTDKVVLGNDEATEDSFLTTAQLKEIKEFILKSCTSNVDGVNRNKVHCGVTAKNRHLNVISKSIMDALIE